MAVSAACQTEAGAATEAAIAAPSTAPSTAWFLHVCFMLSKLPVCGDVRHWRWPFFTSFLVLWASEGDVRQFFGGWFLDRLGLNPAGVWLFRLRAGRRPELPPKLPLQLHPQLHPLHGFCMVFFMLSKLPVWRCQALALAFLHLSCGRPKATLGTFSGAGFWTGWA